MNEERSYEKDMKILNSATPGFWRWEEDDDMWQLFGGEHGHLQLIKAPKHGTDYAEYWPEREDAELIVEAPDAWKYWMEDAQKEKREVQRLKEILEEAIEILGDEGHLNTASILWSKMEKIEENDL